MSVHDDDFLAAVPRHLVDGLLQQFQLQMSAVRNCAGFVASFEDLAKIVFGKDNNIFLLRRRQSGMADIQQIGSKRQMRTVLFKDSEGQ
jgi:hypothetical protein